MRRRTLAAFVPIAILIAACSSSPAPASSDDGGGAATEPGTASSAPEPSTGGGGGGGGGGDSMATADVTISGGDKAGEYHVDITVGGCSTGLLGPGTFGVASTEVDPSGSFMGPQITIYDAAAAAGGTDLQFSAAFPFDDFAVTVEVNPYLTDQYPDQDFGSGTATLDDRGGTATVTVEGTASDGSEVNATIECHQVANF